MMANREGSKAWPDNRLTSRLGLQYPIIQGPLGGLSSQRLTAAVSNYGGLGSFAAHSMTPGAIKDVIAEIRSLTSKPFAVNLWVSMEDESARTSDESAFNRSLAPLAAHIAALRAPRPEYTPVVSENCAGGDIDSLRDSVAPAPRRPRRVAARRAIQGH
jgi:nitronate monooxygenase